MNSTEAQRIQSLTDQMTTRCIGRYLMDVPTAFVINDVSRTEIEEVTIEVKAMNRALFDLAFKARHNHLSSKMQPGRILNRPHLRTVIPLSSPSVGGIFDRVDSDAVTYRSGRTLELMAWRDGYTIFAQIDASDWTFPEDANSTLAKQFKTDVNEKLALLLSVYDRTRGRRDDEIPSEQGVCFANGFTAGPPTDSALITMAHDWREVNDVYFSYSYSNTLGKEDSTLLQRANSAAVKRKLVETNGKTLRAATRRQHGLEFEEWLMQNEYTPDQDYTRKLKVMSYDLTLELNTLYGNTEKPFMALDLTSGFWKPRPELSLEESAVDKPIARSTLSAAETIALWDKVTATLRPRPGAF